jgi:hypothetical protein
LFKIHRTRQNQVCASHATPAGILKSQMRTAVFLGLVLQAVMRFSETLPLFSVFT